MRAATVLGMLVHALHPVPIEFIPARARKPRWEFLRVETPVEISEFDPERAVVLCSARNMRVDGRDPIHSLRQLDPALIHAEDRFWCGLRFRDRSSAEASLRAALEGTTVDDPLRLALMRSPAIFQIRHSDGKGVPFDDLKARKITQDTTDQSRSAFQRFCREDLAIAGDTILMRAWEPLLYAGRVPEAKPYADVEFYPGYRGTAAEVFRIDGRAAGRVRPTWTFASDKPMRDDDLRLRLNCLVGEYERILSHCRAYWDFSVDQGRIRGERERVDDILGWLRPLAMRAALGGVPTSEARHFSQVFAAMDEEFGFPKLPRFDQDDIVLQRQSFSRFVDLVCAPEHDADDVAAIAAL